MWLVRRGPPNGRVCCYLQMGMGIRSSRQADARQVNNEKSLKAAIRDIAALNAQLEASLYARSTAFIRV